jgi:hypothetical protein
MRMGADLPPEDRPVHQWYRFVLSYPPHLVRRYIHRFELTPAHRVLDPFCGTGTTLVECKKIGIPSVGLDAHPAAHFASQVKTDWTPDPDALMEHAARVADDALAELRRQGLSDDPPPQNGGIDPRPLRTLPPDSAALLPASSISPLPLHKTLVLRDAIERHMDRRHSRHELLALAKTALSASNLRFGPEVGAGPPKTDAPVITAWLREIHTMATDLRDVRGRRAADAAVHRADSRDTARVLEPRSVDAVITSPPYPNEKDYTRAMRLESVLLGMLATRADLRALKTGLVRSNTRTAYRRDDDDRWAAPHPEVARIARAIEERRAQLGKTSGFERLYARVITLYFGDMARHLAALRPVLRTGARLAYVVGDQASYFRVLIPTGQLLGGIAASLGYEVESLDLFRTRLATATGERLREEVLVLRWPA